MNALHRRRFLLLDVVKGWGTGSRCRQSTLAFEEAISKGDETKQDYLTAVIAHGLLGQARNFRSFASKLATEAARASGRPWRIFSVDLRCHGNSATLPGIKPPHNIQSSAADLIAFVDSKLGGRSPDIVCGHSLGGKVALSYCEQVASQSNKQLPLHTWILDSQPGKLDPAATTDVAVVLDAVKNTRVPVASREALYAAFEQQKFSQALLQWMGSSLIPVKGDPGQGLTWNFDVEGASAMYASYQASCMWHMLSDPPGGTMHVLRAELSDRWTQDMIARLDAAVNASQASQGTTVAHVLPNAGHWVHADQPSKLREMMLPSFRHAAAER